MPVRKEFNALTRLAAPVAATQLGMMLMGVVDILMVGHVGTGELAAASLGRLWVFGSSLFGMGLLLGVDPLITQAYGSRNMELMARTVQRGLVLGGILSIVFGVVWLFAEPGLKLLGQDPLLAHMARDYVWVQIPSLVPLYAFFVLRQYLMGRGIVRPMLYVVILANLLNVFLNYGLIFGRLGFPEMGLTGAGIATAFTRLFMLVVLIAFIHWGKLHHGAWLPWSRAALDLRGHWQILRYGFPISIQVGLEMWTFQIATLLAGRLGTLELASHTVAMNLISVAFMVPLGISMGAVTRVGNLIGAGQRREAQIASWVGLGMGAVFMLFSGTIFVVFGEPLCRLYTDDAAVLALATSILPIGAAFQIADGIQVVGGGILRGMGRTVPAAVFNLVAYWVIGIPLAIWFVFGRGMGVHGIWTGLAIGLWSVSVMLVIWIHQRGPARVDARISEVGGA